MSITIEKCPKCNGVPERHDIEGCHGCMSCDFTGTKEGYDNMQKMHDEGMQAKRIEDEEYQFDIAAEEVAKKRGLIVVLPQPNQLQIDIDSGVQSEEFERRFKRIQELDVDEKLKPALVKITESGSGGEHYHITLTFGPDVVFDEWQRIALQAALNDDPIRVYLNAVRKQMGVENPSRLFEKP